MRDLLQLYDGVLKTMPFSIIGYSNFDHKLYKFYDKLSHSDFIKYNQNFNFLCSAILRLEEKNDSQITWELKSYTKFYFKSFKNVDKRAVVTIYFFILNQLNKLNDNRDEDEDDERGKKSKLRPSLIFSELFSEDLDLKICLFNNNKPFIDYDKDKQLFEVKLPYSIYNKEHRQKAPHQRNNLAKRIKEEISPEHRYVIENPDGYPRFYQSKSKKGNLKGPLKFFLNGFYEELFDISEVENTIKDMKNNLPLFEQIFVHSKERNEELFINFSKCCIALSFWCFHYRSAVEYMMSVGKVEKKKVDKNWITEKRNLGGLIIGYNKEYELKTEERAILNLTSDRLTSVAAGQMLFEENKELTHEVNREKLKNILSGLDSIFTPKQGHGQKPINKEGKQKVNDFINRNEKWFGGDFGGVFNYLCENNENHICKYWLTKLTSSIDIHNESNVNDVDCLFRETIDGQLTGKFSSNHINVPFINSLFQELTINHKKTTVLSKYFEKNGTEIKCEVTYEPHFNYDNFINCVKESLYNGSFVGTYLIDYYDLLMAHGNFLIKHDGKTLFDVENYIKAVENDEIILYDDKIDEIENKKINNEELTTLDLIFINKLEEE